jgi:hypothetical protein
MNARMVLGAVVLGLTLSACFGVPITESDFEWRYPVLSKSGCPDLTGTYNVGQPVSDNEKMMFYLLQEKMSLFLLLTGGELDL